MTGSAYDTLFGRGDVIQWEGHERVIVMARADGYYMLRRPGKMPFILSARDLEQRRAMLAP